MNKNQRNEISLNNFRNSFRNNCISKINNSKEKKSSNYVNKNWKYQRNIRYQNDRNNRKILY